MTAPSRAHRKAVPWSLASQIGYEEARDATGPSAGGALPERSARAAAGAAMPMVMLSVLLVTQRLARW